MLKKKQYLQYKNLSFIQSSTVDQQRSRFKSQSTAILQQQQQQQQQQQYDILLTSENTIKQMSITNDSNTSQTKRVDALSKYQTKTSCISTSGNGRFVVIALRDCNLGK